MEYFDLIAITRALTNAQKDPIALFKDLSKAIDWIKRQKDCSSYYQIITRDQEAFWIVPGETAHSLRKRGFQLIFPKK